MSEEQEQYDNEENIYYPYFKAYNVLMDYFDCLCPEDKDELDKRLREVGL